MMQAMRWSAIGTITAIAILLGGCGKKATDSVAPAPPPPPPPDIQAVSPPARSTLVGLGTSIWVEFVDPLDPLSVTTTNVFFKIDTVRLPIAVGYDTTTHRITVIPQTPLTINTTYTVELSPNILSAAGVPLGTGYLWQFTTTSIWQPTNPFPAAGAVESPFTELSFRGNETTPGTLFYEIYAGTDSAAVAARSMPYRQRVQGAAGTVFVPQTRWTEHGSTYWSVTIENVTIGERSNGPVWRFDTPAVDAAVDSLVVPPSVWGYRLNSGSTAGLCRQVEFYTGPTYTGGVLWQLANEPSTLKLAGAKIELTANAAWQDSVPGCQAGAWLTTANLGCSFVLTSLTDELHGHLSGGVPVGPRTVRFDSDTLICHISATLRRRPFYGYFFRSAKLVHWIAPANSETQSLPVLKLFYYTNAGPQAGSARGGEAATSGSGQPSAPARDGTVFPLDRSPAAPSNFR